MTRLPREWVASLALSTGLLLSGCNRSLPQPTSAASSNESVVSQAASERPATEPPRLFTVPDELAPLPHVVLRPMEPAIQSVQAQYAQTESIYAPQPSPAIDAALPLPQSAPRTHGPQQAQPTASPPRGNSAVGEQTRAMIQRASHMAKKGMLFAAKNELAQALQLVAQANDVERGASTHVAALSAGLTALKEADDFSAQPGSDSAGIRVGEIARGHRTTILRQAGDISPVVAQQHYYGYAQAQLSLAVAGEPAASQALYTLGKIQMALAGPASQSQSLHGPRAMVCYQAALAVDSRNYQAANELGVLLARYGQLTEARRALLHSVQVQPHVEGWHNLATVHRRLGETELAQLAENERQLLASKPSALSATSLDKGVTWVDPRTFAASAPQEPGWSSPAPPTASTSTTSQRR